MTDYVDADSGSHPFISEMPFMILKANSNKIRGLRQAARTAGIKCVDFLDTMTVGTYVEQIERTKQTKDEALIHICFLLVIKNRLYFAANFMTLLQYRSIAVFIESYLIISRWSLIITTSVRWWAVIA